MDRVYNFSSGPAMLPLAVLKKASEELFNYKGSGMSIMEIHHNSPEFNEIITSLEASVRELLSVPQNYKVLFLRGGAVEQYAAIPLNLFSDRKCADYIISGETSRAAYLEAKKYGDVVIAASSGGSSPVYNSIPSTTKADFRPDVDYVYMRYANTTYGTKFNYIPDTGNIPLVADMTGFLFSEPIDVTKFGLIFASAESNFGIAGLTLVIVRDDLISRADPGTPSMLNYKLLANSRSMYDTPPVYNIYVMKLMVEWMLSIGGLEELKRRNEHKASLIYDELDNSDYYTAPVNSKCRSMMNIRFHTDNKDLDEKFIKEAEAQGLVNLRADNILGGMCASIYNSMPIEGIEKLKKFMNEFAQDNRHEKLGLEDKEYENLIMQYTSKRFLRQTDED